MAKAVGDAELLKLVSTRVAKEKHQILKMAIPSDSNDAITIQRALQVIQRLLESQPDIYPKHSLQVIFNLVHSSNQQIKEEVGRLIIAREDD